MLVAEAFKQLVRGRCCLLQKLGGGACGECVGKKAMSGG